MSQGEKVRPEVWLEEGDPTADGFLGQNPFAMPGRNHEADHVALDARIGANIEAARRAARRAALADAKRDETK